MFDSDFDPVTPAGSGLLADLGLDTHSVRDALADDRARRCPDREAQAGERPVAERETVFLGSPGAAIPEETSPMFDSDFDPVTPAGSGLLADLGLDTHSVRDALADDRARRCPDREAPPDER